ncbi:MAG: VWA domain-containing protein [Phycisphaeraceae bacterium]
MDWINPWLLLLIVPCVALAVWLSSRSVVPMPPGRRRAMLVVRCMVLVLAIVALAGPALERTSGREAVIFIMDHSQSQGEAGMRAAYDAAARLAEALPDETQVGYVSAGASPRVLRLPGARRSLPAVDLAWLETDGGDTDLAAAVTLARGLIPAGRAARLVIVGDGFETRGDLEAATRQAALAGVMLDAVPVAGEARPDVRVAAVRPSRTRLHEGAQLAVHVDLESSLAGEGRVRLFENGIEVDARPVTLDVGQQHTVTFQRTPEQRNLYRYRAVVERFADDTMPENNQGLAVVDVRGRPVLLHIEGEAGEGRYLADAMASEGIRLVTRPASGIPRTLQEMAGYDGVVFSDLPASEVPADTMTVIRDYVEQLGGGFVMIGGRRSFGVGGYYRTPIEQILPVRMQSPDTEERSSVALALVIDRSGSMSSGGKLPTAISASIASVELLEAKDFVGVVPFDSQARWLVPMTAVTNPDAIIRQIETLTAGGGTNIYPGMELAEAGLLSVDARVKHMIVLTDGQTSGSGYDALAQRIHEQGITVSAVGVGQGADMQLMQTIAAAGGGQFYGTQDAADLPRIFAEDTMIHMGEMIREHPFTPRRVERHPMLAGFDMTDAPALLGYVRTHRKATAQVPLVTDHGEPLLAVWRFGLGKVAAFTSDSKARWASLWLTTWQDHYHQFWAQVLRDVAREPQGDLVDIHLVEHGEQIEAVVDLLADAARFENEASVEAEVFFMRPDQGETQMASIDTLALGQVAPGRYAGRFAAREPGLYMVRARSGGRLVSAGLVRNVSSESATGQVNSALLERVTALTAGTVVATDAPALPVYTRTARTHHTDLRPLLLQALLLLFLADVILRRWDNVLAMLDTLRPHRAAV